MTKKPKEQEQVEKIKVISPEIIVTMMGARPYYEIKYFDISDCKWYIGYSSYDLKNVIEWKNECFEVIDTNDGWIPCSERLPEGGIEVLCTEKDTNSLYIGLYQTTEEIGDRWFDHEGFTMDVVAWQPLPPAYKGE